MLHPFGCSVFPCLTPYNHHKLQYHSQLCLFLGYSDSHKGFRCMASSGRVYISRHVVFNHQDFPYKSLFTLQPNQNFQQSTTLLPLHKNRTWVLVPAALGMNIIGSNWIYRIKYNPNGSIQRYKARLVSQSFSQTPGLDYFETFSPVIKPTNVRVILTIAASFNWPVH